MAGFLKRRAIYFKMLGVTILILLPWWGPVLALVLMAAPVLQLAGKPRTLRETKFEGLNPNRSKA